LSAFLAMFTQPQNVLTCFDRSVKTCDDVNIREISTIQPILWLKAYLELIWFQAIARDV